MMWEKVRLGDVFTLIRNGASIKQFDNASGLPITRIETISSTEIDKSKLGYANIVDGEYNDYYLQNGDILMSHINSLAHLGKCALVTNLTEKIIHGMNLLLLRCAEDVLDSKYAKYYFTTPTFKQDVLKISNQSVNQCSFSLNKLKELQIPLPPLPIQKRIAEILDTADTLRRKDEALLKKYDELAQAIFIDMFDKNRNVVKLNEITTKITDGVHAKPNYQETGIPFLSVKNATKKFLDFSDIKYISEIDHKEYTKRCKPEFDDILYTKVGATYGRAAIVDTKEEFSIYVSLALIKPDKNLVYPFYLNFVLNSDFVKRQADRRIKGAGVPDLHLVEIKDFDIPLPSFDKQLEFSNIIENLNKNSLNVKVQMDKSIDLFNSLLQKAFNGELVA